MWNLHLFEFSPIPHSVHVQPCDMCMGTCHECHVMSFIRDPSLIPKVLRSHTNPIKIYSLFKQTIRICIYHIPPFIIIVLSMKWFTYVYVQNESWEIMPRHATNRTFQSRQGFKSRKLNIKLPPKSISHHQTTTYVCV